MSDSVAGLVLAAGEGTRLRPLTLERPKPLCPVGEVALVDRAIAGLRALTAAVAVNTHVLADQVEAHLDGRVHVSREPELLGTGGAVGHLRTWIDGRPVVMVNADTVHGGSLSAALDDWDGRRIRFLVKSAAHDVGFHPRLRLLAVVMPAVAVAELSPEPSSIFQELWQPWAARGAVEVIGVDVAWFDCGTPRSYLAAHEWLTGQSRCVWPGAEDRVREWMTTAIVTPQHTVLVR